MHLYYRYRNPGYSMDFIIINTYYSQLLSLEFVAVVVHYGKVVVPAMDSHTKALGIAAYSYVVHQPARIPVREGCVWISSA